MGRSLKVIVGSSIVRKQIVALTGLLLCGFLVAHLVGNCLMFVGPRTFNIYAYKLTSTPLIYLAEAVLALIFLTHLGLALKLSRENRIARGGAYFRRQLSGRGATFASSSMPYTGIVVLVFVIFHVKALKFGPVYYLDYGDGPIRDLFRTCVEYFSNPWAVIWYVAAMAAVATHTYHGFWSAFQSLGVHHPKYTPLLRNISRAYALCMGLGFSVLPVYCYILGGRS